MGKNIFLVIVLFSCMASFGKCRKKAQKKGPVIPIQKIVVLNNNELWMRYDETKCANPWQLNWVAAPSDEQLAGAVKANLEARSIPVIEIKTQREKDKVSCEACDCVNGFHYFVRTYKVDASKLTELKFVEVRDVPEGNSNQK